MIIWMYLSPIFYSVAFIPEPYRAYAYLNPMTHLIEGYRDIFLNGAMPDLAGLGIFYLFAMAVFATGYLFFTRNQHSFADIL
jgi:lipopolysaccharide transport system permease protein